MHNDEALKRAERDHAQHELDEARRVAQDFAKALQETMQPDADVFRIASEALARHPEYDSP